MRIVERSPIEVFNFSELSDSAKNNAITLWINETQEDWDAEVLSLFNKIIEAFGFREIDIDYSGFSTQGSGARFTGYYNYIKSFKSELLKVVQDVTEEFKNTITALADRLIAVQKKNSYKLYCTVYANDHLYVHSNTMSLRTYKDAEDDYIFEQDEDEDELENIFKEIADLLYRTLEKTYEDVHSVEAAKDYFENCDEEFLANGERFN